MALKVDCDESSPWGKRLPLSPVTVSDVTGAVTRRQLNRVAIPRQQLNEKDLYPLTQTTESNPQHTLPIGIGQAAVIVGAAVFAALLTPAAANAQESTTSESDIISRAEIAAAEVSTNSGQGAAIATEHLASEARNGNLHDASEVRTAIISDETVDNGQIELVWTDDIQPTEIFIGRTVQAEENFGDAMVVQAEPTELQINQTVPEVVGGSGYGAADPGGNWYIYGDTNCWSSWFTPTYSDYTDESHELYQCYEKIANAGTDDWVYNRWAITTLANSSAGSERFYDYTIRTRPFNGYESRIDELIDMEPWSSSNCNGSVTIGAVAIDLETSFNCERVDPIFETSDDQFGSDWDTAAFDIDTPNQMRMDAAGRYEAADSNVVPVWSDYTYVGAAFTIWGGAGGSSGAFKYIDQGW